MDDAMYLIITIDLVNPLKCEITDFTTTHKSPNESATSACMFNCSSHSHRLI